MFNEINKPPINR